MGNDTQNTLTKMQLTPAQIDLLQTVSHLEASDLYEHLSATLGLSITGYIEKDGHLSTPTQKTLDAWYFTLQLLLKIHLIAAEKPN